MKIQIANKADMDAVFNLRNEVFVVEQGVLPQIERDAMDATATHVVAYQNDVAVGCARLLFDGDVAHLGRLAVKKHFRNRGVGATICLFAVDFCRKQGCQKLTVNAQLHATDFYKKLGFASYGDIFWEANMPHVAMSIIL